MIFFGSVIFSGCIYENNDFGLYANSKEEYWSEIDGRFEMYYKLKDLVFFIEVWNTTSTNWNRVYDKHVDNSSNFRYPFIYI